ncbi:hypothetical protein, partial [Pseudomonas putida]|uniref:hypothetical protein n=1 Tax=Pseudomonas putida TaxID=303 RepID=UPI002B251511
AGVLGIGEGHLLHRKTRRVIPGILSKSGSLLQDFPKQMNETSWPHANSSSLATQFVERVLGRSRLIQPTSPEMRLYRCSG